MNALIVGAGPSGNSIAEKLASSGYEVSVFEEHPEVGKPVACTGIVTKSLFDFVEKGPFTINKLKGAIVTSPSGNQTKIPLEEWVICRKKFDKFLMKKAESQGAKFNLRHKFIGIKNNQAIFKNKGKEVKKSFDILIGADGPFSSVGRATGLIKNRKYFIGSQATISGKFDPNWFLTFFGKSAPGFFAWAVPENSTSARVGVATQKNVYQHFETLRKRFNGKITDRQAGPIPIYNGAKSVQKNNIFLVGDAAGLCKNTTGGGIVTGLWSSKVLADCITKEKDYSKTLNPLRRELWLHQKLRNSLNKFSEDDYNKLIHYMSAKKLKKVLSEHPREYPSKFLWKLAISQPRLIRFLPQILSS